MIKTMTELKWAGDSFMAAMNTEMLEAYRKSGDKIAAVAKAGIHNISGDLARTVRVRVNKKQNAAYIFAGTREKGGAFYAFQLEYGTYDGPAHPFMRPAVDKNFNSTLAEAEHQGRRIINKERRMRKVS